MSYFYWLGWFWVVVGVVGMISGDTHHGFIIIALGVLLGVATREDK